LLTRGATNWLGSAREKPAPGVPSHCIGVRIAPGSGEVEVVTHADPHRSE
jgi:hypothetical protein